MRRIPRLVTPAQQERFHRPGQIVAAVGGLLLILAPFLPWAYDSAALDNMTVYAYPSPLQLMALILGVVLLGLLALGEWLRTGRRVRIGWNHGAKATGTGALVFVATKKLSSLGCATSGVGSNQHVLMEWFAKVADIKLEHVPYRGAGQAINDLIAGHVKVAFLGPTATLPQAAAGTIKLLAQTGEARSPSMPELPTLIELGYAGVAMEGWYGAFAPLNTSAAIITRLNAEFNKAMADAASREALGKTATDAVTGTPELLAKLARADSDKYARIVKEVNIKLN